MIRSRPHKKPLRLRQRTPPKQAGHPKEQTARTRNLQRIKSRFSNGAFVVKETVLSRIISKRPLKLLFSRKPEWEGSLRKGFRWTIHNVDFGSLDAESVRNHDLTIPLTLEDTKLFAENRVRWGVENPLVPDFETIILCDNKSRLNQTLIDKGFGDYIPQVSERPRFPYLLKKKADTWGMNTHLITDAAHEESLLQTIHFQDYFKQELIAGTEEFATHILIQNGRILSSLTIRHSFRQSAFVYGMHGARPDFCSVSACPCEGLFESMLKSINYHGLCCIDYKMRDGRPAIFEVNPRFGASLSRFFFAFVRNMTL